MDSFALQSESSLKVDKDILSFRVGFSFERKETLEKAIKLVSNFYKFVNDYLRERYSEDVLEIKKSSLRTGVNNKRIEEKNSTTGRIETKYLHDGYYAGLGMKLVFKLKDIKDEKVNIVDVFNLSNRIQSYCNSSDNNFDKKFKNALLTLNYDFEVSEEAYIEARKKLKGQLLDDALKTASEIYASVKNEFTMENIKVVKYNIKNPEFDRGPVYGKTRSMDMCLESSERATESPDTISPEVIKLLILEGVEPDYLNDSIYIELFDNNVL